MVSTSMEHRQCFVSNGDTYISELHRRSKGESVMQKATGSGSQRLQATLILGIRNSRTRPGLFSCRLLRGAYCLLFTVFCLLPSSVVAQKVVDKMVATVNAGV